MQGNKKARRKNKKVNYLMTLVFTVAAALAIYFAVSFFSAYKEINEKKEELANLQTQKEEQVQLNKDIEKTIKENDEAAIAEKYARENGYVKTDERVYIDITPGT
ncbi:MAG: septum formation initiator family protein [Clostridia bacterium]|jgi:cell division protein FtsL|nr:septum formation initiator family protein [Clostridia bacterium]